MKIRKLLAVLLIGSLLSAACAETMEEEQFPEQNGYVGTLSVIEIGDALFEQSGVSADYVLDAATGRLDLFLYEVSFSSQMPVKLGVVALQDVAYSQDGTTLTIADTDLVPMMEMRGEWVAYDRYVCTDFTGTVTPSAMTLSMKLGGFQTDYRGTAVNGYSPKNIGE